VTIAEATKPLRVILVEDSPRVAERILDICQSDVGADIVYVAADEQDAIRAALEYAVDVMILDLQLRQGTGFGVLKALGAGRPTTIIMTSYALPQYRAKAAQLGVEYFLDKSLDFERLPEILAEISDQRSA
jgi:DNA-binding NarL/FixJ family response regulator